MRAQIESSVEVAGAGEKSGTSAGVICTRERAGIAADVLDARDT